MSADYDLDQEGNPVRGWWLFENPLEWRVLPSEVNVPHSFGVGEEITITGTDHDGHWRVEAVKPDGALTLGRVE